MIKAAFFDIDGTLYDWQNRRFVESGVKAIKKLQKNGVKVFLCSARPLDSMKRFGAMDLGFRWDGWVGSGGGTSFAHGKFVHREAIDSKTVRRFCRYVLNHGLTTQVVTPSTRYLIAERDQYFAKYAETFTEPWCPIHPYYGSYVSGFMLYCPREFDEGFQEAFPDLVFNRFHDYALDVIPVQHSKGRGIKAVLDAYGLTSDEAIGFGDDYPDIKMKEGLSHLVIMGNSPEDVKSEAEFVTDRIENDGIQNALIYYGLI